MTLSHVYSAVLAGVVAPNLRDLHFRCGSVSKYRPKEWPVLTYLRLQHTVLFYNAVAIVFASAVDKLIARGATYEDSARAPASAKSDLRRPSQIDHQVSPTAIDRFSSSSASLVYLPQLVEAPG